MYEIDENMAYFLLFILHIGWICSVCNFQEATFMTHEKEKNEYNMMISPYMIFKREKEKELKDRKIKNDKKFKARYISSIWNGMNEDQRRKYIEDVPSK